MRREAVLRFSPGEAATRLTRALSNALPLRLRMVMAPEKPAFDREADVVCQVNPRRDMTIASRAGWTRRCGREPPAGHDAAVGHFDFRDLGVAEHLNRQLAVGSS